MYSLLIRDLKSTSCPGSSSCSSWVPWALELCLLGLFSGEEVVPHTLHIHWCPWSTRALEGPIVEDLPRGRHVGPYQCGMQI